MIEMQYGTRGKRLCLRLSSALERQKWVEVIATAVGMPVHAMVIQAPAQSRSNAPPKDRRATSSKLFLPQPVKIAQPALSPILQNGDTKPVSWSLQEYYSVYIVAAAPHPIQQSPNWSSQQRPLPDLRYTNARGITFEPSCC
ncbi:hypothetical protein ON010_g2668 [Phytophthora cinnamomi]|nr:hypothetical protein ON010_g2668 [Phytophthora cinnamomi]